MSEKELPSYFCWKNVGKMLEKCWKCVAVVYTGSKIRCWKNVGKMLGKCWKCVAVVYTGSKIRCWENVGKLLEKCWKNVSSVHRPLVKYALRFLCLSVYILPSENDTDIPIRNTLKHEHIKWYFLMKCSTHVRNFMGNTIFYVHARVLLGCLTVAL